MIYIGKLTDEKGEYELYLAETNSVPNRATFDAASVFFDDLPTIYEAYLILAHSDRLKMNDKDFYWTKTMDKTSEYTEYAMGYSFSGLITTLNVKNKYIGIIKNNKAMVRTVKRIYK